MDAQKDFIASCDLDGLNFKENLKSGRYLLHPFAVGIYKDLMYWDDWSTKSVYMAQKNDGKGVSAIVSEMDGAMDLKIFSSINRAGNNSCSARPCSHLCIPKPNKSYVCLCPDGESILDKKIT